MQKGKQIATSVSVFSAEGLKDISPSSELKSFNQIIDMKLIAAPAIPATELKEVIDHFGKKHFNNEGVCYADLRNGQAAAFKKVKRRGRSDREFLAQVCHKTFVCWQCNIAYDSSKRYIFFYMFFRFQ